MEYPAWLGELNKRDEATRRAHGLLPTKDGWYKTIRLKKRYIARPMPLADAVKILPAKIADIEGRTEERIARVSTGSTTIIELVEMFLAHLWQRHMTGVPRKLSRRTYDDYMDTLSRFVETVGPKTIAIAAEPSWFTRFSRTIAKKASSSRRRDIIYLTSFFNWAGPGRHSQNFYRTPVNFGPDLVKPDEGKLRQEMAESSTLYESRDYFTALMAVRECPLLYAVGLMALNCAYLGSDITAIPESAVDLETGVVEFPRPKTGIQRKCVLMPETSHALRKYLQFRGPAAEGVPNLFVRADGKPFSIRRQRDADQPSHHGNAVGKAWSDVTGLPIKGLRTTFATLADGHSDQRAVDLIMGHAEKSVRAKHYVKSFEPERLAAVVSYVWLQFVSALPLPAGEGLSVAQLKTKASRPGGKPATHAAIPA